MSQEQDIIVNSRLDINIIKEKEPNFDDFNKIKEHIKLRTLIVHNIELNDILLERLTLKYLVNNHLHNWAKAFLEVRITRQSIDLFYMHEVYKDGKEYKTNDNYVPELNEYIKTLQLSTKVDDEVFNNIIPFIEQEFLQVDTKLPFRAIAKINS